MTECYCNRADCVICKTRVIKEMPQSTESIQRQEIAKLRRHIRQLESARSGQMRQLREELKKTEALAYREMMTVVELRKENARLRDQIAGLTAAADSMHLDLMSDPPEEE